MENLVSVADRLQWAINLGQEHDANPYQRALLSYIAFRSGPENVGAWPSREKISRDTGMHENTITRVLSWWVDRGVLLRTRRHHSSTTYQLQESEHHRGALTMADAQIGEPDRELDDANCQNTTEVPIKEPERNKENEQEKDNTYTVIRELREYLWGIVLMMTYPRPSGPSWTT